MVSSVEAQAVLGHELVVQPRQQRALVVVRAEVQGLHAKGSRLLERVVPEDLGKFVRRIAVVTEQCTVYGGHPRTGRAHPGGAPRRKRGNPSARAQPQG